MAGGDGREWRGELAAELDVSARELKTRARNSMGEWLTELHPWDALVTMTYDQEKIARARLRSRGVVQTSPRIVAEERARAVSHDVAWSHLRRWFDDVGKRLQRPLPAFVGLELQKNGWPHFHALVAAGGLQDGDVRVMHDAWFGARGFVRVEAPRGVSDVAAYVAKYCVKELDGGDWWVTRDLRRAVQGVLPALRRGVG